MSRDVPGPHCLLEVGLQDVLLGWVWIRWKERKPGQSGSFRLEQPSGF